MDLRSIANNAVQTINSDISVVVQISTGFTIDPTNSKQVPTYNEISGFAQIQALDADDIKQLDGLNIQGTIRAIYLRGALAGVVTPNQTGGDLVLFDNQTWLVVRVLESWPTWSKAAIVLQSPSS